MWHQEIYECSFMGILLSLDGWERKREYLWRLLGTQHPFNLFLIPCFFGQNFSSFLTFYCCVLFFALILPHILHVFPLSGFLSQMSQLNSMGHSGIGWVKPVWSTWVLRPDLPGSFRLALTWPGWLWIVWFTELVDQVLNQTATLAWAIWLWWTSGLCLHCFEF